MLMIFAVTLSKNSADNRTAHIQSTRDYEQYTGFEVPFSIVLMQCEEAALVPQGIGYVFCEIEKVLALLESHQFSGCNMISAVFKQSLVANIGQNFAFSCIDFSMGRQARCGRFDLGERLAFCEELINLTLQTIDMVSCFARRESFLAGIEFMKFVDAEFQERCSSANPGANFGN